MKHMTKLLALLLICVLLPLTAQAYTIDTEEKWNKQCLWKTNTTTPIYSGEEIDGEYVFTQIGTVAAGKWLGSLLYGVDDMAEMSYWNNGMRSAFFPKSSITKTGVTIYAETGDKMYIPQMAYGDEEAVRHYLSWYRSPEEIEALIAGMKQGLVGEKDENGQFVIVKMEPLTPPTITLNLAEDNTPEVEMVLPGLARSTVLLEGAETIVPTADLTWDAEGAAHPLAVIYAPKTGLASLYARDEGKGGVIKKLKAGSVVMVMGESGKYTKVYGEGTVGYVITSALEGCDPAETAETASIKHKTNLRLTNRDNGRKIIELPKGAEVIVLSEKGKWARVEYQGFVGYVEKKLLKK